jgi:hypothetical protein
MDKLGMPIFDGIVACLCWLNAGYWIAQSIKEKDGKLAADYIRRMHIYIMGGIIAINFGVLLIAIQASK